MTNLIELYDDEDVDREAERIKRVMRELNEPIKIEWGTIKAMDRKA